MIASEIQEPTSFSFRKCLIRIFTSEAAILLLFVLAGALFRYLCIPVYQVIAADGPSYINISREILSTWTVKGSIHYPPFYPFLIALANFFTKDLETAGVVVSMIAGSLLVVPVFLLGKELFSPGAGYVGAAITLVWPEFVAHSSNVLAFSTYFTLLTTGLYLLWSAYRSGRNLTAILSGLSFAAAYLTRQEAFISMLAVCSFLAVASYYQERSLARLKPVLIAFALFSVLIFPYIRMVHEIMGIWTLAGKSVVTLTDCLGYYLGKTDLNRDPAFTRIGLLEIIRRYPGYLPYTMKSNFAELVAILPDLLLVFAGIGIVSRQKEGTGLTVRAYIIGALSPVIVLICIFIVSSAYIAPYLPFLFVLCGHGLITTETFLLNRFSGRSKQNSLFWLTGLVIFGYLANTVYNRVPRTAPQPYRLKMDQGRYDQKQMGKILGGLLPPDSVIMTRSGRIAFYSGFSWVDIPQTDLQAILQTAREKNVRFLVVDGQQIMLRPQLGKLLSPLIDYRADGLQIFSAPEEVMPGLFYRLSYTARESQGFVVYEFRQ